MTSITKPCGQRSGVASQCTCADPMQTAVPGSLLVFADDWGRHPSSCQHLVRCLLPQLPVCWVNTIGTRRPALSIETVRRATEKCRQWCGVVQDATSLPQNLQVARPLMLPWNSRLWQQRLNARWLQSQLRRVVARLPKPVVAVTTIPVVAELVGKLDVSGWVYYCVDDFSTWPGLDQQPLAGLERRLLASVDQVIAVSEHLQARLADLGRESALVTHGVDLSHWSRPTVAEPAQLQGLETPIVLFWGVVDRRIDIDLVQRLSSDLQAGAIVLMGPKDAPDPRLLALPRVVHLPPVSYDQLSSFAAQASVLIMPYADLPVTRAMQPLKLKEYLATGRPVVVSNLPSTRPWHDCLRLASSADEFSAAVRAVLAGEEPAFLSSRAERLACESWQTKSATFFDLLAKAVP